MRTLAANCWGNTDHSPFSSADLGERREDRLQSHRLNCKRSASWRDSPTGSTYGPSLSFPLCERGSGWHLPSRCCSQGPEGGTLSSELRQRWGQAGPRDRQRPQHRPCCHLIPQNRKLLHARRDQVPRPPPRVGPSSACRKDRRTVSGPARPDRR